MAGRATPDCGGSVGRPFIVGGTTDSWQTDSQNYQHFFCSFTYGARRHLPPNPRKLTTQPTPMTLDTPLGTASVRYDRPSTDDATNRAPGNAPHPLLSITPDKHDEGSHIHSPVIPAKSGNRAGGRLFGTEPVSDAVGRALDSMGYDRTDAHPATDNPVGARRA